MARVAIAFGSNLGHREQHISWALARLQPFLTNFTVSCIRETAPVGVTDAQPSYLNGVATGDFDGEPRQLLSVLQDIETAGGRERPFTGAARTIDLDLILFGDRVLDEQDLQVPHPRFRDREFVLGPLAEVAPGAIDPVTGTSVRALLARLKEHET